MTVSDRDKKILMILVPFAVVLGYWFLLMAPKREAAATAETTLQAEQATLAEAEANANTVSAAKANFARDYAAVVALGKAIPSSVDMPSLLVQLEQAANGTGIELDSVTTGEREPVTEARRRRAPPRPPRRADSLRRARRVRRPPMRRAPLTTRAPATPPRIRARPAPRPPLLPRDRPRPLRPSSRSRSSSSSPVSSSRSPTSSIASSASSTSRATRCAYAAA